MPRKPVLKNYLQAYRKGASNILQLRDIWLGFFCVLLLYQNTQDSIYKRKIILCLVHSLEAEKSNPWVGCLAWTCYLVRVCLLHTNMIASWDKSEQLATSSLSSSQKTTIMGIQCFFLTLCNPNYFPQSPTLTLLTCKLWEWVSNMNSRCGPDDPRRSRILPLNPWWPCTTVLKAFQFLNWVLAFSRLVKWHLCFQPSPTTHIHDTFIFSLITFQNINSC